MNAALIRIHHYSLAIIFPPFQHSYLATALNYYLVCTSISCVRFAIVLVFALCTDNESKSVSDHLGSGSEDWIFNARSQPLSLGFLCS